MARTLNDGRKVTDLIATHDKLNDVYLCIIKGTHYQVKNLAAAYNSDYGWAWLRTACTVTVTESQWSNAECGHRTLRDILSALYRREENLSRGKIPADIQHRYL